MFLHEFQELLFKKARATKNKISKMHYRDCVNYSGFRAIEAKQMSMFTEASIIRQTVNHILSHRDLPKETRLFFKKISNDIYTKNQKIKTTITKNN